MSEAMYFMLHLTGIVACITASLVLAVCCVQMVRSAWND
jgi:hypothetical protein